mgnify:FL=1
MERTGMKQNNMYILKEKYVILVDSRKEVIIWD